MLAAGMACSWYFFIRDTGPIPRKFTNGLHFNLYYPARLPDGYTVDGTSFKREGDVLVFSIIAPNNRNIAVSEQATPTDAPTHQTKDTPVKEPGEKSFTTGIGSVHIGLWSDKYVSDIITDGTWIILNTTGFTTDEATAVTQGFSKL